MTKQLQQYIVIAFVLGFAFEFGGQLAWIFMDGVRAIFEMPLGQELTMKLSKRQWKWQQNGPIFEKHYWMGLGLGLGFFNAEIVVSGITKAVNDILMLLI